MDQIRSTLLEVNWLNQFYATCYETFLESISFHFFLYFNIPSVCYHLPILPCLTIALSCLSLTQYHISPVEVNYATDFFYAIYTYMQSYSSKTITLILIALFTSISFTIAIQNSLNLRQHFSLIFHDWNVYTHIMPVIQVILRLHRIESKPVVVIYLQTQFWMVRFICNI